METEIVDTLIEASKNAFTSQINGHNLETLGQIRKKVNVFHSIVVFMQNI